MSAKASWRVCVAICMASAMVASSVLANTATPTRTKTPPPKITPTPLPTNTPICPTPLPTNTPPPTPTPTPAPGTLGCSDGYCKEHPTVWPDPYDPTDILGDVFALGPFVNLNGDNVSLNTDVTDPNQRVNVNRTEIKSMGISTVSPMPASLLNMLKEDEILDLVAYVLSGGDSKHRMFAPAAK